MEQGGCLHLAQQRQFCTARAPELIVDLGVPVQMTDDVVSHSADSCDTRTAEPLMICTLQSMVMVTAESELGVHAVRQHVPVPPLLWQVPEVVVPARKPRLPLPCGILMSPLMYFWFHCGCSAASGFCDTKILWQVRRRAKKSGHLSCRSCCSSARLTAGSEAPGRPSTRGLSFSTCTHPWCIAQAGPFLSAVSPGGCRVSVCIC